MTITRAPRIVTVCVHGTTADPRDTEKRLQLIRLVVDAVLRRQEWLPLDAIVFPGGFLRLKERVGHGDFEQRAAILGRQPWMPRLKEAIRNADHRSPGLVIVTGSISSRGKHEAPEQVCLAVGRDGVIAEARKIFPTLGETSGKRPLIATYRDYAAADRYLSLANGSRAVLCACYDGFGLAESPQHQTVRIQAIRYLSTPLGVLSTADPDFKRLRGAAIGFWHERLTIERPDVAFAAIHGFHRAGLDGFWQRHGIASASAALNGGLVAGAAHFGIGLPGLPRSTLAALNVPPGHLSDGLHRKAHRLLPVDGFQVVDPAIPAALVRLFLGTYHEQ